MVAISPTAYYRIWRLTLPKNEPLPMIGVGCGTLMAVRYFLFAAVERASVSGCGGF
jgi:hypothetical protein